MTTTRKRRKRRKTQRKMNLKVSLFWDFTDSPGR
jgi:hypothetical protein